MGFRDLLYSLDWQHQSYPTSMDLAVLPLFVLFFPLIRLILDKFVFEKFGRKLVNRKKKLGKFKESAFKCIYHLSAEILALSVTYNEPWLTNTKYFWQGPGDQVWPDQKMKMKLKGLYMYSGGFYLYAIFALVFWETRRSDFIVSMSHHIATTILIVFSYTSRFCRVGSVVLAIHDANDVFLEVSKMAKYSGAEAVAYISFFLFAVSWFVLRLTYFPFWILWSTSYEVVLILDMEKHPVAGPVYYYVFNTLLYWLMLLNIYWGFLIFRMLVKIAKAGWKVGDDVRSDSDEDEDNHEA